MNYLWSTSKYILFKYSVLDIVHILIALENLVAWGSSFINWVQKFKLFRLYEFRNEKLTNRDKLETVLKETPIWRILRFLPKSYDIYDISPSHSCFTLGWRNSQQDGILISKGASVDYFPQPGSLPIITLQFLIMLVYRIMENEVQHIRS